MPDRSYRDADEIENRAPRRSPWAAVALLAALIAATALGYAIFTRSFPALAGGIVVGDYTNMTQADAQEAVVNAGLRTRFTTSASETVPPNHVIRQSPLAGTKVERNQVVELVVSNGRPLRGLDDVRGYNAQDAQRTLQQEGFAVTLNRRFDNTVRDNVIDQLPKPGAKVPEGSRITLTVSNGPPPVTIPNFVGMPVDRARALAAKLGIALDTSQSVPGLPAESVASQSLAQGTTVDRNATVRVIVNSGMPNEAPSLPPNAPITSLPNVVGNDYNSAEQMLAQSGFQVSVRYVEQSANNGKIVEQVPPAGDVAQGSTVTLMLSVSGEVPDTEGLTPDDAIKTLQSYGYAVGRREYTTAVGADGKVVGTDPGAGTRLAPGSSVTMTVNGSPP